MQDANAPLAGIRVVELTTAWAGPMAGRILAFLGAEVIHLEAATRLDSWRQHGNVFSPYRYPRDGALDVTDADQHAVLGLDLRRKVENVD